MSSRDATLRHGVANAGLRWLIVAAVSMIGVGTVVFLKSWDTGGTADLRDRERIVASQRQASGAGTSGRESGSEFTDEQRACLQSHGVTELAPGTKPTDEQWAAFRAAAAACGLQVPAQPGPGP